jgi:Zn-dependent peptidase ImmA (M78 family)
MMDRITTINPQRVAWCLADLNVSPEQAAKEASLPLERLNAVLEGDGGLTFGQLRQLADYLGRSVLFLLDASPIDAEGVNSPQFRTLAGQKPDLSRRIRQLVQRTERQRALFIDLSGELEGEARPGFKPPQLPGDVREAARIARHWLGLAGANTFEGYRGAVERNGILVFRTNGYAGQWQIAKESPILGFALYDAVLPTIVVKKQEAESRQTFTLMHELGHVLLHKKSWVDDEADLATLHGAEREANQFAAHLLVPDEYLVAVRNAKQPADVAHFDQWLGGFRNAWGVSADVILLRLVEVGFLPQQRYDAYRRWRQEQPKVEGGRGSRAYRYREPSHVFGDRFVRTVLGALSARKITLSKASDYLDGLKVQDLHKLERFYAGA